MRAAGLWARWRGGGAMAEPVLQVRGLCKSFGALAATDEVSLELVPGEIHALIGPNGAGKSTLIAQLGGTLRPDAGQIVFDGRDITGLAPAKRAALGLARTFQVSSILPEFSARLHLRLACQAGGRLGLWRRADRFEAVEARAAALLDRVGLGAEADVPAADLSHGGRRRLEVALALAGAPRAFLMDEPMAGLGAEGTADLTAMLRDLKAEAPILLVEHDMDAVFALADRITVLVYGRVIASGSGDQIRSDPAVQEAYLGT